MAKSNKIPKPQGSAGVTKVRHPKSKAPVTGGSIAEVCKPRDASSDPEVFLGELMEETIPEVDSASTEPTKNPETTAPVEALIEEPVEETVIEEIPVPEPQIDPDEEIPLAQERVPVVVSPILDFLFDKTPPKPIPKARIVVKCALYTHRGRKVTRGQSFVVEGQEIFNYGNPDMFDIFYF
jgi:hypothetical protein